VALMAAAASSSCLAGGSSECSGTVVQILPLADVTVAESQVVSFNVTGQGQGVLSFDGLPPQGATLTPLSTSPPVASFYWIPTAAQVGAQQVSFRITGPNAACDTETVTINVQPGSNGQPQFLGDYRVTVDVSAMTPSIQVEVMVQDDDTPQIQLSVQQGTEIPGAMLQVDADGKTGSFTWMPTPDQITAACTYSTTFIADDGTSQVAQQLFIQFRPPAQPPMPGCGASCPPGTPPTITTTPLGNQDTLGPFPVTAMVSDMESSIQQVLLLWTNLPPAQVMSVDQFTMVMMTAGANPGEWMGDIPAQQNDVAISYFVCAVDNDDPNGPGCDRVGCTLDSNMGAAYTFLARQGMVVTQKSKFCEPCASDGDCEAPGVCDHGRQTCTLDCTTDATVCPDMATCVAGDGGFSQCQPRSNSCSCQLTGQGCLDSGGPIINEVYPDPNIDTNGDGTVSTTNDEFVEIVNTSFTTTVDISNWAIEDAYTITQAGLSRFSFPAGTMLPPRSVALVFGGGDACAYCGRDMTTNDCLACPNGLQVFAATAPGLSLNNTGDSVYLVDQNGNQIDFMMYTAEQAATNDSLNRQTDADPTAPFVLEPDASGSNGSAASPGYTVDGRFPPF
jgi:hypothetical protein